MQHTTQGMKENPMRAIQIEKITLNMGTSVSGDTLEKAMKLLQKITQNKPVATKTKKRIPTWGVRPGLDIGAKVTVRGKKAKELLVRLFKAKDNVLSQKNFDSTGNVSFGISEYLSVPGVEYDASIGIIGFEVAVTLMRPGFRIRRRAQKVRKIPLRHGITPEEAKHFMQDAFKVMVK